MSDGAKQHPHTSVQAAHSTGHMDTFLARMWKYYYDEIKDKIQAKPEGGTEVYTRMDGRSRQYSHLHREQGTAITGHPATIVELDEGALKM